MAFILKLIFRDFIGSSALFNAITISSVNNLFKQSKYIINSISKRKSGLGANFLFYNCNKSISIEIYMRI